MVQGSLLFIIHGNLCGSSMTRFLLFLRLLVHSQLEEIEIPRNKLSNPLLDSQIRIFISLGTSVTVRWSLNNNFSNQLNPSLASSSSSQPPTHSPCDGHHCRLLLRILDLCLHAWNKSFLSLIVDSRVSPERLSPESGESLGIPKANF